MKLYDFTPAPNPRRVRIFASEKGLQLPTTQVNLRAREQFSAAFRAINPYCTVPVLERASGEYICGARAICGYLEACHPEPPLLGGDAWEQAQVASWTGFVEEMGMAAAAEVYRNTAEAFTNRSLPGPVPCEQIPALAERGRKRWASFLGILGDRLEQSRYVGGAHFSLADITAWVCLDFSAWSELPGVSAASPGLQRWYEGLCARPSAGA